MLASTRGRMQASAPTDDRERGCLPAKCQSPSGLAGSASSPLRGAPFARAEPARKASPHRGGGRAQRCPEGLWPLPGVTDAVCPPLDSTRHKNSYLYRVAHRSRLVFVPKVCAWDAHPSAGHRTVRSRNTKGFSIKTVTKITDHLKLRMQSGKV